MEQSNRERESFLKELNILRNKSLDKSINSIHWERISNILSVAIVNINCELYRIKEELK